MTKITEEQERELRRLFRQEAEDHLETLNRSLMAMERTPATLMEEGPRLLRTIHSLKGAAAAVGFEEVAVLGHEWESCVAGLLDAELEYSAERFDALYQALDTIQILVRQSVAGTSERENALEEASRALNRAFGRDDDVAGNGRHTADAGHGESRPGDDRLAARVLPDEDSLGARISSEKLDMLMSSCAELVSLKASGAIEVNRMNELLAAVHAEHKRADEVRVLVERAARMKAESVGPVLTRIRALLAQQRDAGRETLDRALSLSQEGRNRQRLFTVICDRIQDDIRAIRMVPVARVFYGFPRMVRDLASRSGKSVAFTITGADIGIDRDVLEPTRTAVMHILRNSIDHGIESPAERQAAGKPAEGRVRIAVTGVGKMLCITVADDGRGIALTALRRATLARQIATEEELAQMDDDALRLLIFDHGFSTTTEVSELSGRGVGLDAVRVIAERLGGRVAVDSEEHRGTEFRLSVPVSLAAARMMVAAVEGELYAIPLSSIDRVVRVRAADVVPADFGQAIEIDGHPIPIRRLGELIGLARPAAESAVGKAIILGSRARQIAFLVDGIVAEEELVVKDLGAHLDDITLVVGVTVLVDGRVVPILNTAELLREAGARPERGEPMLREDKPQSAGKVVLVVDDSLTTRTMEKGILEAAGYTVRIATDGIEALEQLGREHIDVILSDVQMPRMDGYELTKAVRDTDRTRRIPVILMSSLGAPEERERGLRAGADAYIAKRYFDQDILLATLARMT